MLNIAPTTRIFVHSLPTDMRRQFDGLSAIVQHTMQQDIFTGDYFVFFNRACTHCKIICWEGDGFALWAKRLERNCYQRLQFNGESLSLEIDQATHGEVAAAAGYHSCGFAPFAVWQSGQLSPESKDVTAKIFIQWRLSD